MSAYFRNVPDFEYVSRTADTKQISEYQKVKNLFKRGKLKNDIFNDLTYFTKYQIVGNDRPDNVAFNVYEDETLDWVILLSNNITNIQTEWPLNHQSFYNFLIDKYGEWIVYKPPLNKGNLLLWILPYLVFIAGATIIFLLFKKREKH